MSKNIYNRREAVCPVCKTKFELKYPNPKMYAATSRDEDERVTGYSWVLGVQTDELPHYYAVMQCPKCFYTDFRERLEKPGTESKDRILYQAFAQLNSEQRNLIKKLHQLVTSDKLRLEAALALHLSAIFITLLPGNEMSIDQLKLGRLYLRLSWLYKEQNTETSNEPLSVLGDAKSAINASITTKLVDNVEALEEKIQAALDLLEDTRQLAEERTRELDLAAINNPFVKYISAVESDIEHALQTLSNLEHVVMQDKNRILVIKDKQPPLQIIGFTANGTEEANTPPTLETLIPSLISLWPQLPRTELSAAQMAVEAFEKSFQSEEVSQSIHQSMVVGNIILQLLQKIGALDRALTYSSQLYKNGTRDKQKMQAMVTQGQRNKSMDETEIKELNRIVTIITNTINKAVENRRKLQAQIYERDKEKINRIMIPVADAPADEQIKVLTNNGIPEEIIAWLKEQQLLNTEGNTKKKKWFGK